MKHPVTIDDVQSALGRIRDIATETPIGYSETFSKKIGTRFFYKMESVQKTGSFKIRGAVNRIRLLKEGGFSGQVVAASAGNHAQGVAHAAQCEGLASVIYMPEGASQAKAAATRHYGGEVRTEGQFFDEAVAAAQTYAKSKGAEFIHAYEDPPIIAGQGTIGLELNQQVRDLCNVVVPIGGGGLIAGIALALKSLNPKIRVIGVQAENASAMAASKAQGQLQVKHPFQETMADGIQVKRPSAISFEYIQKWVDEIVTVSEEEIGRALLLMMERMKVMAEGSGAVATAALLHGKVSNLKGNTLSLVSGANIDLKMIKHLIETVDISDF